MRWSSDSQSLRRSHGGRTSRRAAWSTSTTGTALTTCARPGSCRPGFRSEASPQARTGHHLAPLVLSSGASIFERLAGGFTLVALDGDQAAAAAFQAAAADLGIPLLVVADTFDAQRAAYGQRFILVRPDQHVAWTGNGEPADAAAVLRRAVGAAAS